MKPAQRDVLMQEFCLGSSRVLATTELLAGDLDFEPASLIINYDLPTIRENYMQRIACLGPPGRHKATVINLVTTEGTKMLHDIQQFYETLIEEMPVNIACVYSSILYLAWTWCRYPLPYSEFL